MGKPWFGLKCLLRLCGHLPEWVGADRKELWAVCQTCGRRSVFLEHLDDVFPPKQAPK